MKTINNSKKTPKSKFLRIICPRCKTNQVVFGKSAMRIKCLRCNYLLLKTFGGKAKIMAQVKEIMVN